MPAHDPFRRWRQHRPLHPRVLIPAVVAIALVGCGIGALVPNAPAPFPGGRTADGWVASSEVGRGFFNSGTCGFSFGSVEIVKYVVQGTTYRLVR